MQSIIKISKNKTKKKTESFDSIRRHTYKYEKKRQTYKNSIKKDAMNS